MPKVVVKNLHTKKWFTDISSAGQQKIGSGVKESYFTPAVLKQTLCEAPGDEVVEYAEGTVDCFGQGTHRESAGLG